VAFLLDPTHADQPQAPVEPGRQDPLHEVLSIVNAVPLPHVGHQRGIRTEGAVRNETSDIRIAGSGHQPSSRALADAEETDTARVGVRPAFQVSECCLGVMYLVVGHPLEWVVAGMAVALSLVARLESEDVET